MQLPFRLRLGLQLASFGLFAGLLLPRVCAERSAPTSCAVHSGAGLAVGGVVLPLAWLYLAERRARVAFAAQRAQRGEPRLHAD